MGEAVEAPWLVRRAEQGSTEVRQKTDARLRTGARWFHQRVRQSTDRLTATTGGPARRNAILLLAAVLALSGADVGAISALAPQLESAFRLSNAGIGLLVTVSTLVGAVATLPVGVLTDRMSRTRLLSVSILVWGATELISGFSFSFLMLLVSRIALGAVTATAGPAVASLTGDLFGAQERSRIYGMILTGELVGAGVGVIIAGDIGAAVSWRVGLAILALPSLALSWAIHRHFPEPARGGQSRLVEGDEKIRPSNPDTPDLDRDGIDVDSKVKEPVAAPDEHPVLTMIEDRDVKPDESLVRAADSQLTAWQAIRWVCRVRTNLSLIIASALGYFFLSGLRTFALIYARGRFGLGQGMATILFLLIGLAAVAGVLVSGRWTDRFIYRGRVDARLLVGGAGFLVAVLVFIPALLTGSVLIGLPLFLVAAFALAAPNPPIDAARLDVVPSQMWGRAESIRTAVRTILEAVAPLIFGVLSAALGGGHASGLGAGVNQNHAILSKAATNGLNYTFLIMLVTLAISGLLVLRSRRTYLGDVVTAAASEPSAAPHKGPSAAPHKRPSVEQQSGWGINRPSAGRSEKL
jgi:MFS family permease